MTADSGPDLAMPALIRVTSGELDASPQIARLVEDVRRDADHFVFLSGGASKMSETDRQQLLDLMNALALLADRGVRFAVGDGGTEAGLMAAAGSARVAARLAGRPPFPLVGIAPAPELDGGATAIDPNHSHIVAVENTAWVQARTLEGWSPDQGYWGSETDAMFDLFHRLSIGRPAVAIVGNGGAVTLHEVRRHVEACHPIIVIAGSGRAADALVSLLEGTTPSDPEVIQLAEAAQASGLTARPELYELFPAGDGPSALADAIARRLTPPTG